MSAGTPIKANTPDLATKPPRPLSATSRDELSEENGMGETSMTGFFRAHMTSILRPFAENVEHLHAYCAKMAESLTETTIKSDANEARLKEHHELMACLRIDMDRTTEMLNDTQRLLDCTIEEKTAIEAECESLREHIDEVNKKGDNNRSLTEEVQQSLVATRGKVSQCREQLAESDRTSAKMQAGIEKLVDDVRAMDDQQREFTASFDDSKAETDGIIREIQGSINKEKDDPTNINDLELFVKRLHALDESALNSQRRFEYMTDYNSTNDETIKSLRAHLDKLDGERLQSVEKENALELRLTDHDVRANEVGEYIGVLQEFMESCAGMKNLGQIIRTTTDTLEQQGVDIQNLKDTVADHGEGLEVSTGRLDELDESKTNLNARARRLEKTVGLEPYVPYPTSGGIGKTWSGPRGANLTDKQLTDYQAAFKQFDSDGDGTITPAELGTVMEKLGQTPSEDMLKDMISEVDNDGSGAIQFNEFCQLMHRLTGGQQVDPAEAAKRVIDNMSVLARQKHVFDLVDSHTRQLAAATKTIEDTEDKMESTCQRVEVVEFEQRATEKELGQLRQGLDLTKEYWKGLSKGLKETKTKMHLEGEGELLAGTKQIRNALPPLVRPSSSMNKNSGNLTAR